MKSGRTKESRKQYRQGLGKLRGLTVQPKTKQRYNEGLNRFFDFLHRENLSLPHRRELMDDLVSDYLEFLWAEGEGRASASNFMAALQDYDPKLKHCLPASWRLLKTWSVHEVPSPAPPLTEDILKAMVGWAALHQHYSFALSLLVAFFYPFMRRRASEPTGVADPHDVRNTAGCDQFGTHKWQKAGGSWKRDPDWKNCFILPLEMETTSVFQLLFNWKTSRLAGFVCWMYYSTQAVSVRVSPLFSPKGRGYAPFHQMWVPGPSIARRSLDCDKNCQCLP